MTEPEQIELEIEQLVAKVYWKFYQLRQLKEYQREYDAMGALNSMLNQDRQFIREKYGDQIDI